MCDKSVTCTIREGFASLNLNTIPLHLKIAELPRTAKPPPHVIRITLGCFLANISRNGLFIEWTCNTTLHARGSDEAIGFFASCKPLGFCQKVKETLQVGNNEQTPPSVSLCSTSRIYRGNKFGQNLRRQSGTNKRHTINSFLCRHVVQVKFRCW